MNQEFKIRQTLARLDLSEIEITAYLNLLKLGSAPASIFANRSQLNRSTARYHLDNLVKKRMVFQHEKNGTFYFTAEDPEKVLLLLKQKKAALSQTENAFGQIMGDLKKLQNPHTRIPKVQFFEGEGVKTAYQNAVEKTPVGGTIYAYVNLLPPEIEASEAREVIAEFIKARTAKKINLKMLMPCKNLSEQQQNNPLSEFEEVRLVEASQTPYRADEFGGEILLYEDTLQSFFVDEQGLFAYEVNHPHIIAMHRHVFESLWELCGSSTK